VFVSLLPEEGRATKRELMALYGHSRTLAECLTFASWLEDGGWKSCLLSLDNGNGSSGADPRGSRGECHLSSARYWRRERTPCSLFSVEYCRQNQYTHLGVQSEPRICVGGVDLLLTRELQHIQQSG
jgi:hypothetical protein